MTDPPPPAPETSADARAPRTAALVRAAVARLRDLEGGTGPVAVAVAPGRVNLIGEHVDHAGGPCLPVAIDRGTAVAVRRRRAPGLVIASDAFDGVRERPLPATPEDARTSDWSDLAAGAIAAAGGDAADGAAPLQGLAVTLASDLPPGAGLASSAACGTATLLATRRLLDGADDAERAGTWARVPASEIVPLARLVRAVERAALGTPCGLMDMLASLAGRRGRALLVTTAPPSVGAIRLPETLALLVVRTALDHRLADGDYARVPRCAAAAACTLDLPPGALARAAGAERDRARDRAPDEDDEHDWFDDRGRRDDGISRGEHDEQDDHDPREDAPAPWDDARLPGDLRPVVRHVVREVRRVRAARTLLARGDAADLAELGRLVTASHRSLADDLEVSTPALDRIARVAAEDPEAWGGRMVGGGFGGSALVLAPATAAAEVGDRLAAATDLPAGSPGAVIRVRSGDGARTLLLSQPS